MGGLKSALIISLVAVAGQGCAMNPSPPPMRPSPKEVMESAYGSWVVLEIAHTVRAAPNESPEMTLEKGAELRAYPIAGAEKSKTLMAGDRLTIVDSRTAEGAVWWFVETSDGARGWLRASALNKCVSARAIEGELIAVQDDTVFVMTPSILFPIARQEIIGARLFTFDAQLQLIGIWTMLGALSTLSHGYFLVLSFPSWILIGTASASAESNAPIEKYPEKSWNELRVYARFPQGLPRGIDRTSIQFPSVKD